MFLGVFSVYLSLAVSRRFLFYLYLTMPVYMAISSTTWLWRVVLLMQCFLFYRWNSAYQSVFSVITSSAAPDSVFPVITGPVLFLLLFPMVADSLPNRWLQTQSLLHKTSHFPISVQCYQEHSLHATSLMVLQRQFPARIFIIF